ncbi:MAG: hypothetical protein A4E44_00405 [Methanosaeta sp. PtaB.Bin018]|jgi:hypothetical protein|nr:MAG: hypothetical protein A4E44_00405 [Methanosaeta sp. PtaB.Bin018]OPY48153.1 MAG: hypothetical protein A4E46_00069 [Methanosaeta sp. PtaU1.Bin016]
MGRQCTVCNHRDIEEINRLLLCSDSYRDIARRFGLSKDALARHKDSHIPELLLKSQDAKEALQADNTFSEYQKARARIEDLQSRTYDLLAKAEAAEDHKACIGYIRECRGLESELREQRKLLAELEGKLAAQPQINLAQLNIYQSPEWSKVGNALARILAPYPELRVEVAKELLALQEAA